jgi:spermidine synthase
MFFIFVCVGGSLRESLKWASVEKVVMVELDAAVIKASREYLPSYSNCTGFGTPSCFDDERVELYTEDFIKWFDDHIGNDICQRASE